MSRLRSLRGVIAVVLTAICLVLLAVNSRLPSIDEVTSQASFELFALAFLLIALTIVCKAARWLVLYPTAERPKLGAAVVAVAVGQLANWALPIRAGELARLGIVSSENLQPGSGGRGVAVGTGVLIAEKLLDGLSLLLTVGLLAGLVGLPEWANTAGLSLVAVLCVVGLALSLALRDRSSARWIAARLRQLAPRFMPKRISDAFGFVAASREGIYAWLRPGAAVQTVLWSFAAWGLGAGVNYVVLKSLGMEQGWDAALAVLVALYGGAALPSLPGRVGIFQYLCVLSLAPFGVEFDQALVFSLVLYAVVYLPPVCLGLLSIVLLRPSTQRNVAGATGVEMEPEPMKILSASETEAAAKSVCGSPPRYSVIVPAYNAAGTIDGCLQALMDQSVPPELYEVLVVDDGSSDDTAEKAGSYRVRLFQQHHGGPATARNLGAKMAVGEYFLFTDADCVPVYTWIEELVWPLENDCKVDGAKGAYRTKQDSLIARLAQVEFEEKYAWLQRHLYIDFVDTYSGVFRRSAFWEGGGFDPVFRVASNEDTQLSFNLAAQGRRLVFADKAVVFHRHSESIGRYLLRKWRHGYWRVYVYRHHPRKVMGDSYTPLSTQIQFLSAVLMVLMAVVPWTRAYSLVFGALFLSATLPFVRRSASLGWRAVITIPLFLFIRSLALGTGLAMGIIALPFMQRKRSHS